MPLRDVTGHRHLLELLGAAASRGTLPPSLIFAGPEGVGKRTTAVAVAQTLNCLQPAGNDACGVCRSCSRIARGVHPDILILEPGETGSIKVDQIREAIDQSAYRPFEARRRVVIIDRADAMMAEAQNAMLKTLEEPPASSIFILVTPRPDLLLPTVRSRCQRLRFGPLSPAQVADVLVRAHGYDPVRARAAASASDGSVGAALDEDSEEFADAREGAQRLLQSAASSKDPRRRLDGARAFSGARAAADREELGVRLRSLASMLRDLCALRSSAGDSGLANGDLKPFLVGLMAAFDAERTLNAFDVVGRALEALDRNASPKIVADWVAVNL
jgi:DNA polymerase-3 subunit delta'